MYKRLALLLILILTMGLLPTGCKESVKASAKKPKGLPTVTRASGPDPVVTFTPSKTTWHVGDAGTFTITVVVPATEAGDSKGAVLRWRLPRLLTPTTQVETITSNTVIVTDASGDWISNVATLTFDAPPPDANGNYTIPLGTIVRGAPTITIVLGARM